MKNSLTRLLTVIVLAGVLWIVGCEQKQPGNESAPGGTDAESTKVPTDTNSEEADAPAPSFQCGERTDTEITAGIMEMMKKDDALQNQVQNVVLSYSDETLYVKGFIYGPENISKFYSMIAGVSCAKNVSFLFMTYRDPPEGTCSGGMCQCGSVCTECPCRNRKAASSKPNPEAPAEKAN